jgi:hypothetical protein
VESEKSDFEKHMKQFKSAMEQTGASTQMKLQELEYWFRDLALVVVERFVLRNDYEQAYCEAITALRCQFENRKETAEEMLEELLSGEKVDNRNSNIFLSFVLRLENALIWPRKQVELKNLKGHRRL